MGDFLDSKCLLRIITFIISIPILADIILSILSYQEECKTYYIIRFVTQGIILIFIVFLAYAFIHGEENNPFYTGFISVATCVYSICAVLPMEITSLVLFIINHGLLFYLGKIGFYIHICFYGLIFLFVISIRMCDSYFYKNNINYNKI